MRSMVMPYGRVVHALSGHVHVHGPFVHAHCRFACAQYPFVRALFRSVHANIHFACAQASIMHSHVHFEHAFRPHEQALNAHAWRTVGAKTRRIGRESGRNIFHFGLKKSKI